MIHDNFLIEDRRYYVYIYLDPLKPKNYHYDFNGKNFNFLYEPFYVGMGKGNRFIQHVLEAKSKKILKDCNISKILRIQKILSSNKNPIIIKLAENLSEETSLRFESFLINLIGRYDLNLGPLTNLTPGIKQKEGSTYINWKSKLDEFYTVEKRKEFAYMNTIEGHISKYGKIEGERLYYERIKKIKGTIYETYKDQKIRDKCKNFGSKNGFFGKKSKNAKSVEIHGKIFDSIYDASVSLKIPYTTLTQRLNTKKPGYVYCVNKK